MKKFSKALCLIVCSMLLLALAACGANNAGSNESSQEATTAGTSAEQTTEAKAEKVNLALYVLSGDEHRQKLADKFEADTPNDLTDINVEVIRGGGYEDYSTKLKTYNASGDLPDVFFGIGEASTYPLVNAGNVLDLTPYFEKDGFLKKYGSSIPAAAADGKYYSMVAGNDEYFTPRIFYHKTIFEANGITVPKTFDEFLEVCKTLKAKGIIPFTTLAKDSWCVNTYLLQNMIMAEDPQVAKDLNAKKTDFSNPVVINAVNRIQKLAQAGAFQPGALTMEYGAAQDLFVQKKAAMYGMFSWSIADLGKDPDVDFMSFPQANPNADTVKIIQAWGGPFSGYCAYSKSKDVEKAVKLLEYCVEKEALYWNVDQKMPTTYNTGVKIEGMSELMIKNLQNYDAATEKIPSMANYCYGPKTNAAINTLGGKILSGKMNGEEFAKEIASAWKEDLTPAQ